MRLAIVVLRRTRGTKAPTGFGIRISGCGWLCAWPVTSLFRRSLALGTRGGAAPRG